MLEKFRIVKRLKMFFVFLNAKRIFGLNSQKISFLCLLVSAVKEK